MEFLTSLKTTAQKIIELSDQLGQRVQTWNQQESAPAGGYSDRAGLVIIDDLELFTDVYASEDGSESLLRARLSWAPKQETDQDTFTIITLDFNADLQKVRAIIAESNNLTSQSLTTLLNDSSTTPKLIHVSLESSIDTMGNNSGKRYEYTAEDVATLTDESKAEFVSTLSQAYDLLAAKVQS